MTKPSTPVTDRSSLPSNSPNGALAGVRLTDVPIAVRRRYGGLLLDRALKELEPLAAMQFAAELNKAVETPSDRIYKISSVAVERVLRPPPRKRRR